MCLATSCRQLTQDVIVAVELLENDIEADVLQELQQALLLEPKGPVVRPRGPFQGVELLRRHRFVFRIPSAPKPLIFRDLRETVDVHSGAVIRSGNVSFKEQCTPADACDVVGTVSAGQVVSRRTDPTSNGPYEAMRAASSLMKSSPGRSTPALTEAVAIIAFADLIQWRPDPVGQFGKSALQTADVHQAAPLETVRIDDLKQTGHHAEDAVLAHPCPLPGRFASRRQAHVMGQASVGGDSVAAEIVPGGPRILRSRGSIIANPLKTAPSLCNRSPGKRRSA